ncbi:MAG TPA: cbb3-type cytochrome c oxidase subunit I [Kofleriaceae bacterium]|nr:cbb3-type cytochrome c oxidase subunit I [Kofleriaceae bacterium]
MSSGPSQPTLAPTVHYDDGVARRFTLAALAWCAIGLAAGLALAAQLLFWQANLAPALTFARLRPLHVEIVLLGFAGNLAFAGLLHAGQRLLRVAVPSRALAALHLVAWQLLVAARAAAGPLGLRPLEPALDAALALAWLLFAAQLFWMISRRRERRLYVTLWFAIAAVVLAVAGAAAGALAATRGGVDGALLAAWSAQGQTALTTLALVGLAYYLVPAAAERPLHSYRLAVIHFWSTVLLIGWTAPRHLLNTAAPDSLQTLGVVATVLLWAPSWGAVANGLLTARGARRAGDPVLSFAIAALLFLGLASFEEALLALKDVAALAAYTDWMSGHAHASGLGWAGLLLSALLYFLVPRLWGVPLRSRAAAGAHLYLAVVGVLVYLASSWIAGATQGVMLRAADAAGGVRYAFLDTLVALRVPSWGRLAGGALYAAGFLVMAWNLAMTIRAGRPTNGEETLPAAQRPPAPASVRHILLGGPVVTAAVVAALLAAAVFLNAIAALVALVVAALIALTGLAAVTVLRGPGGPPWHERVEGHARALTALVAVAALAGAAVELHSALRAAPPPEVEAPLGRELYLRERCDACHTQVVRPFLWEVARYGAITSDPSGAGDTRAPALWGARRVGPDLAREGGRHSDAWHLQHLADPRALSPGSLMPRYDHLTDEERAALVAYLQSLGTRGAR